MQKTDKIFVKLGERSYPIIIGKDLFKDLQEIISKLGSFSRIIAISDSNVSKYYLKKIREGFTKHNTKYNEIVLPSGEKTKSFAILEVLLEKILGMKIDRKTLILCVGGGVIGDLVGLASSLLLRGLNFIQIPTSLLAQVDSSVGGKTAINSKHGKNLIGTFFQPLAVIISLETLKTLEKRQIIAGYAEILKYSFIMEKKFFFWLHKNGKKVISLDYKCCLEAIKNSCKIKSRIVKIDEKEKGIREILNFGHTFGHAIESFNNYSKKINHGESIFIGMVLALKFSVYLGICKLEVLQKLTNHLEELNIPYKLANYKIKITASKFLKHLKYDKKIKDKKIKFILLKDIGKPTSYVLENQRILIKFLNKELV